MNWGVVTPLLILLAIVFVVGMWSSRKLDKKEGFLSDYFLGSREFGGLLLAMTMVATYASASSFLGGPGAAYSIGFGWVRSEECRVGMCGTNRLERYIIYNMIGM